MTEKQILKKQIGYAWMNKDRVKDIKSEISKSIKSQKRLKKYDEEKMKSIVEE